MARHLAQQIKTLLYHSGGPLSVAQLQQRLQIERRREVGNSVAHAYQAGGLYRHRGVCPIDQTFRQFYWVRDWQPTVSDPQQCGRPRVHHAALSSKALRGSSAGAAAGNEAISDKMFESRTGEKRDRFPTDKPSLRDRNKPLTLRERLRLERWAVTA